MLEMVLTSPPPALPPSTTATKVKQIKGSSSSGSGSDEEEEEEGDREHDESSRPSENCGPRQIRVWADHLTENRKRWKLESAKNGN